MEGWRDGGGGMKQLMKKGGVSVYRSPLLSDTCPSPSCVTGHRYVVYDVKSVYEGGFCAGIEDY